MSLEGSLSSGNIISGAVGNSYGSYGGVDLQGSLKVHHQEDNPFTLDQHRRHPRSSRQQGSMVHRSIGENFSLTMGMMQDCDDQTRTISLTDFTKGKRSESFLSDEDEPSFVEDAHDNHNHGTKGKKMSPWQRVKWSDPMVRLLITAVSYIGMEYGVGARRKYSNLQKKGKWKSVSKAMAERGHFISPQQCEDKFNDLNKRYKRLNEILGRGTSCQVVENPVLLDIMDHVSDKAKEEVRKILSSKHLYYEEMCSYHNGNRLHLPPDPELQHSLQLALGNRDDHDSNDGRRSSHDDLDEDDMDDHDDYEDHHHTQPLERRGIYEVGEGSAKRTKQCEDHGRELAVSCERSLDCSKNINSQSKILQGGMNQALPEGEEVNLLQEQWMKHRLAQLEEQKVHIKAQMLELEKERFKWQRFCIKKDRELDMMRMENERMRLENDQMALELKHREMSADIN